MIDSLCPVCGSANVSLYLDDEEVALNASIFGSSRSEITHGRILRCRDCEFGFRQVRSNVAEMAELYRKMDVTVYAAEAAGRKATAARHSKILERFKVASGEKKLLDVGCASGYFLYEARKAGWLISGVEPSESLYAQSRQVLGEAAELHCATLEQADLASSSFDAITLWDVLEHVPEPLQFMKLCARLLKPGGRVILNVPDLDSFEARTFGKKWPLLLAEHLNYFNRKSLRACCDAAGLTWIHFGRRRASFSLDYILLRLSQHNIPLTDFARKVTRPFSGKVSIPVHLGETFAVWSR